MSGAEKEEFLFEEVGNEYLQKLIVFDGLINIIPTEELQQMFHIDQTKAELLRFELNHFEFDWKEGLDYFKAFVLQIMDMEIDTLEEVQQCNRSYMKLQKDDPYAVFWHLLVHKTFYILTQNKYKLKTCNVYRVIRCSDGYYAECEPVKYTPLKDVKLKRKKDKKDVLITILEGLKNTNGRYNSYNVSFSHRHFTMDHIGWDGKRAYICSFWSACITKSRAKKDQLSSLSMDGHNCKNPSYDACTFILSLPASWDSLVGQLKTDIYMQGSLSFDKDIKAFHPKNILKNYFSSSATLKTMKSLKF